MPPSNLTTGPAPAQWCSNGKAGTLAGGQRPASNSQPSQLTGLNLLQAAVLGSVIGVERGWAGRPAGIRTMSMVCMGAALFTGVAELVQQNPPQPEREPKPEPAP